jgi:chromosomal replication initiation ATPase DnaA
MKVFNGFTEYAQEQIDKLISPLKEKFEEEAAKKDAQINGYLTEMHRRMNKVLYHNNFLDSYPVPHNLRVDYDRACRAVFNTIKISSQEIESNNRKRLVVDARRFISAILSEIYPYQAVAACMKLVNHTTIMNHRKTHIDYLNTNIYYRESYNKFLAEYQALKLKSEQGETF